MTVKSLKYLIYVFLHDEFKKSKTFFEWVGSFHFMLIVERHFTVEVANRVSKFENIFCGISYFMWFMLIIWVRLQNPTCTYMKIIHACSCSIRKPLKWEKVKQRLLEYLWFVDNKLSTNFGEKKTKSIFLSPASNLKLVQLDISSIRTRYIEIKINQHKHVDYLGWVIN